MYPLGLALPWKAAVDKVTKGLGKVSYTAPGDQADALPAGSDAHVSAVVRGLSAPGLRHFEEMMAERGVAVDHATAHRRAIKILPVLVAVFAGANARWA